MLNIAFKYLFILLLFIEISLSGQDPYIIVLGIAQDGGYPHMG